MFAKLSAVILAIGVCACGLLALRQQRLQAAHELTQAQLRIRAQDEKLWDMRTRIASEVTPQKIEKLAAAFGELRPMIADPKPKVDPTLAADPKAGDKSAPEKTAAEKKLAGGPAAPDGTIKTKTHTPGAPR